MKSKKINLSTKFKIPVFILGLVLASLIIINLTLLEKGGDEAQFALSILFWLGTGSLIWDKKDKLVLETNLLAFILGLLILVFVLLNSTTVVNTKQADIVRTLPFFIGLGCGFIASGFHSLKQFRSELIILFFLGIPSFVLTWLVNASIINIAIFTASTTAFLLSYFGLSVYLEGVYIHLPTGSIEVNTACSGIDLICYMLGLAVLAVIMFPIKKNYKFPVIIFAVVLAFLINAFRVGLMAILVARGNQEAFVYMHEGNGSLVFGMIAVIIFGGFYWLLMNQIDRNSIPSHKEDNFFDSESF
jgi:cyanoexosortase A